MAATTRRTAASGFTLIEMMVALAIFTILMIGLFNLLDTSTTVSKVESALADTQENVRYATYHMMRTARMMGGTILPFARGGAGNAWVAGEVYDNAAGNFAIFGTSVDNLAGSDILVVRGFFDVAPFFVQRNDVNSTGLTVTIREHSDPGGPSERLINDLSDYVGLANLFLGRGLIMATGEGETTVAAGQRVGGQYVVAQVAANTGVTGATPNRQMVLTWDAGGGWGALNVDGNPIGAGQPTFWTSRVGILEAFAYYVDRNLVLRRVSQQSPGAGEPVAINIGNLQVELGIDSDGDTFLNPATEWDATPTVAEALVGNGVIAMRLTVLGRTPFEISGWTEPAVTFASSGNMAVPVAGSSGPRHAKWRRMEVAVALRNFL
jgi:prepilin-type N-terminal cleavage/methylation domain-containing protein